MQAIDASNNNTPGKIRVVRKLKNLYELPLDQNRLLAEQNDIRGVWRKLVEASHRRDLSGLYNSSYKGNLFASHCHREDNVGYDRYFKWSLETGDVPVEGRHPLLYPAVKVKGICPELRLGHNVVIERFGYILM